MKTAVKMLKKIIGWPLVFLFSLLFFVLLVVLVYTATLGSTALDFDYVKAELKEVGAYSLAKQYMDDNMDEWVPGLAETEIYQVVRDSLSDEWLASQVDGALDMVSDYLDGKRDTLEITLSTAGFKESMKTVLHDTVIDPTTRPEGLKDLSTAELETYLQPAYEGIDELPGDITVVVQNVSELEPLREIPEIFHGAYMVLFMVTILLGVLTILCLGYLLDRSAKMIVRLFGIYLFVIGAVCYAIKVVVGNVASTQITDRSADLPSPLTPDLVIRVAKDSIAPAGTYSIIIMVVGVVLFVASFFIFRFFQKEKETAKA